MWQLQSYPTQLAFTIVAENRFLNQVQLSLLEALVQPAPLFAWH
jgi:hypothetical protein